MAERLTVKVVFSDIDPMDAEMMAVLRGQKKKASFIKTALYWYIHREEQKKRPVSMEKDREINNKLSRLEKIGL